MLSPDVLRRSVCRFGHRPLRRNLEIRACYINNSEYNSEAQSVAIERENWGVYAMTVQK